MLSEQFLTFWCLALYWVIFWCLAYSDTHPLERIPSPRQTGTPSPPPLSQSLSGRPAPGEGRVMERVPLELQKQFHERGFRILYFFHRPKNKVDSIHLYLNSQVRKEQEMVICLYNLHKQIQYFS